MVHLIGSLCDIYNNIVCITNGVWSSITLEKLLKQ